MDEGRNIAVEYYKKIEEDFKIVLKKFDKVSIKYELRSSEICGSINPTPSDGDNFFVKNL